MHGACEKLHKVYGHNGLQELQYQQWFTRFCAGDFNLKGAPQFWRLNEVDDITIKALMT